MSADWEYPLGDPRHRPRNMNAYPYNIAEQRVCDYLQRIAPDIGCGDDPVGFLIASHAYLHSCLKGTWRDAEMVRRSVKVLPIVNAPTAC